MITERILDLVSAYRRYGYSVISEPIEGQEEQYANELAKGLLTIDAVIACNARVYHYRGLSINALQALHRQLPEPVWGVELSA